MENTYLFKTKTTMKDYNSQNYWIDYDYIHGESYIKAQNVKDALQLYVNKINDEYYDIISKTAIKNKQKMYIDTASGAKQVGYVLTGKIDIDNRQQYVNLWIDIKKVEDAFK